jgi:hypothetical protein
MFPTRVPISKENIIEDHRTQTYHDEFSDTSNVQRRIEPIGFKTLPPRAFFIAERKHILAEDVAKKTKFETFVDCIRREDNFIVAMEKQNLTSLRMRKKLKARQNNCYDGDGAQQQQDNANRIGLTRIHTDNTTKNRGRKQHCQQGEHSRSADLVPLDYNHGCSSPIKFGGRKPEAETERRLFWLLASFPDGL